jgi:hypothetical protein
VHVRKHLAREPGDPTFTASDLPAEATAKAGGRVGRIGKSKDARR